MIQSILPGRCRLVALASERNASCSFIKLQASREVPFDFARVYYLYDTTEGVTRGMHAHRQLQQFAVAVSGSCKMLLDDGQRRTTIELNDPTIGLILGPMVWREMSDFSTDCVLMVVADAPYSEADYIRDYNEFLTALR